MLSVFFVRFSRWRIIQQYKYTRLVLRHYVDVWHRLWTKRNDTTRVSTMICYAWFSISTLSNDGCWPSPISSPVNFGGQLLINHCCCTKMPTLELPLFFGWGAGCGGAIDDFRKISDLNRETHKTGQKRAELRGRLHGMKDQVLLPSMLCCVVVLYGGIALRCCNIVLYSYYCIVLRGQS